MEADAPECAEPRGTLTATLFEEQDERKRDHHQRGAERSESSEFPPGVRRVLDRRAKYPDNPATRCEEHREQSECFHFDLAA